VNLTIQIPKDQCNDCALFRTWVPMDVGMCFRQYKCWYFKCDLEVDYKCVHERGCEPVHAALPCKACLEERKP